MNQANNIGSIRDYNLTRIAPFLCLPYHNLMWWLHLLLKEGRNQFQPHHPFPLITPSPCTHCRTLYILLLASQSISDIGKSSNKNTQKSWHSPGLPENEKSWKYEWWGRIMMQAGVCLGCIGVPLISGENREEGEQPTQKWAGKHHFRGEFGTPSSHQCHILRNLMWKMMMVDEFW